MKKSTIIKKYKKIPGIEKYGKEYRVLSGIRYLFSDIHKYKLNDSYKKRYVLLKAISKFRYISHKELLVEQKQFVQMLNDLLSAELIKPNNLSNSYGANAYDCTEMGAKLACEKNHSAKSHVIKLIAEAAGYFTGVVISKVYDVS